MSRRAPRGTRARGAGLVLAMVLALVVLPGWAGPGWTAPARAATATDAEPAQVTLTSVSPTPVGPKDTLTVTGTIRNTGDAPISYLTARLHLQTSRLGTRADLNAWTAGEVGSGAVVGRTVDLFPSDAPELTTGSSVPFTLTLNQAELGLSGSPFGVFGLAVEARGQVAGPRQQVGLARTTVIWQPTVKEYAPQQLAWLVPFTGLPGASGPGDLTLKQIAAAVGPGSRLARLLQAASAPGIGWAVDPALLETLADAVKGASPDVPSVEQTNPSTPTDTPTNTGSPTTPASGGGSADEQDREVIRTYLSDLRTAAQGRVVIELPYGDPDVQAISTAGRPGLLGTADKLARNLIRDVLDVVPLTGVAWPADGWADAQALDTLAGQGAGTVILDSRSWPAASPPDYTLDARAVLPQGSTAWLTDPVLSSLVAVGTEPVDHVRQVLAQTATATTERPGLSRRLLITLPRDFDPDPVAFHALFDAVSAAPWTTLVPVTTLSSELPRADTSGLARTPAAPPPAIAARALDARDVVGAHDLNTQVGALGEVLTAPADVTDPLFRGVVGLVSNAWRGHADGLRARRSAMSTRVHRTVGAVHVLPTRANFLANSASLPFTVANDLGEPVTGLRLQITAPSPRLEVLEPVSGDLQIAPGTRTRVEVPVRAVASGRVELTAQLLTPSGVPLGTPVSVRVRTQPPGTWWFWVAGSVVALVLVIGLVRAIRRPRPRVHPPDAPEVSG